MKKIICFMFLMLFLPVPCFSSESHYQLMINAKRNNTEEPILEQNDEVFLSIKDTALLLNDDYEIRQNKTDRSVIIFENGQYSYLKEGRLFGIVHNKVIHLSEPCLYEEGELYLPVSVCAKITGHYFIKSKSYLQFFKW